MATCHASPRKQTAICIPAGKRFLNLGFGRPYLGVHLRTEGEKPPHFYRTVSINRFLRARVRSAEFVWGLQRRFGLHVSAAQADLLQLAVHAGVQMDPLGDDIATDPHTDKRKPHGAVLR
eukprot:3224763-Prymnesium_polylepis.1